MFKNFSPQALGINGRQSELIELSLTYAFRGMDVDLLDMLRRSQRTSVEDATKYLRAADIKIGGFELDIDLDADDDAFTAQVGTLHPLTELAAELQVERAYLRVPSGTDRLPYPEYFEVQRSRLDQIAGVLAGKDIRLAVGFSACPTGDEVQFPFVRDVEGFMALISATTADNIGYLLDTFDWIVGGGAMDQITEIPGSKIVAVRLSSLSDSVDASTAKPTDRVLPEKQGLLDLVALVKHLDSSEFDGPIGPAASTANYKGQTRESIVQAGQEAVDAILSDAGLHVAPRPMDLIEDIPYEPTPSI
ncbi:TIM barrel protein [Crateriforma conspicua]|uniref:Xylose isomerase-like TIM barrel n=1 Tax=Crateriforma conspicua TaxID=2527996 RepID=A0A5C5Y700_9PLAN|nr:TIM barrel protein [Crateriforma conspicua]QDV65314.1 Xylose isomerase-like TIM barrel [Crateriforma conspicua]TWT70709.1 Xylose isomerase-like TIM barrel [Crateriforma conspicua]